MRIAVIAFLAASLAFAQSSGKDPRWQTVGAGTLAARPATCVANRSVYICNGAGCAGGYELDYCTAANTWTTSGGSASTATNLSGGSAGQFPYQTAPGATGFRTPNVANGPVVLDSSGNATLPGSLAAGTTVLCSAIGINSGTTYTLTSANNGCILTFSNASAITVTVPAGLPVGFSCLFVELGAGQVTATPSGTTINQRQGFTKTAGQYAVASLVSYTTNTFVLSGDLQ